MKFLEQIDSIYSEYSFLLIFLIGHFIVQRKNDLKLTLYYRLYSYGIAILLLSTKIPYISHGFPYDISDLENKKRLLNYLQENNEALYQTTSAIRDIVFITFLFSFLIIEPIIKQYKIDKSLE
jgi:hypothetical protein